MPSEPFLRELTVSRGLADCWQTLTDVTRVAGWVSIARDVRELEPLRAYQAVLEDRLGPFRLRADLDISVSEVVPPRSLYVRAAGEDRQVGSQISAEARLSLEDGEGGTRVRVEGRYDVTGRVATLGASMITQKAHKIMDEFFASMARELA